MNRLRAFALLLFALLPAPLAAETYLLMAEEHGCFWCDRWDSEVAEIYPKTAEGRVAPLRRYDIADGAPADVNLTTRVRFTPTFILVRDGLEIDRIEGYPGEDFFWGLMGLMLERAENQTGEAG